MRAKTEHTLAAIWKFEWHDGAVIAAMALQVSHHANPVCSLRVVSVEEKDAAKSCARKEKTSSHTDVGVFSLLAVKVSDDVVGDFRNQSLIVVVQRQLPAYHCLAAAASLCQERVSGWLFHGFLPGV